MNMRITLFLSLFCTFVSAKAYDGYLEKQNFRSLSVANGLPSNNVNCIFQDSFGFMWFGTRNGLSRYDGYQFKTFKSNYNNPTYLTGNAITAIGESKDHKLWIGTSSGLNILDLKTGLTTALEFDELKNADIFSLVISKDDKVFIAANKGVFVYNDGKFELLSLNQNRKYDFFVKTLFIDSKNYLWIAAWDKGYYVYDIHKGTTIEYPYITTQKAQYVNSFFEDKDSNIWLSTWDKQGVFKIMNPHEPKYNKINQFTPLKKNADLEPPVVFSINQDPKFGYIWLATANGIQVIDSKGEIAVYNKGNTNEILVDEIFTIYKDRTGVLWFSMLGAGINSVSFNKNQFSHYYLSSLLKNKDWVSSVTSLYEDRNDRVWLGLKGLGLGVYNKKNASFLLHKEFIQLKDISTKINSVLSFHTPRKHPNKLLIGSRYDGLYSITLNNEKITNISHPTTQLEDSSVRDLSILSIVENNNNEIILATSHGIMIAQLNDSGDIISIKKTDIKQLQKGLFNCLIIDSEQNIWIGTPLNGVYKLDRNSDLKKYSSQDGGINNNDVICLFQDSKNRLWAGTIGGGLSLFNTVNQKFESIDNMELFPDDAIYSILEDHLGSLWLSTGKGLVCYNEDEPVNKKVKTFTIDDGLGIYSFNANSSFANANGELLFGGSNGFISFYAPQITANNIAYRPTITDLYLNNQLLNVSADNEEESVLTELPPFCNSITLPGNNTNLTIEFSTLAYDNPNAVKYAYKLEGLETDWTYLSSKRRFVNYNNLSSGNYTFILKSANDNSSWSDEVRLELEVRPQWWMTWWAYAAYLVLIAIVGFSIYRFLSNKMRFKRMIMFEQLEREKSAEVYHEKMRFFTNISHEFFTPITILKCALDGISKRNPEESKTLETMTANMNRLVKLLEQVVEFRRLETGNSKLKISKLELVSFLRKFCEVHFAPLSEQGNISFTIEVKDEPIVGYIDVDKLDKIIYNLLSNAFKYNKENGSVVLAIDSESENNQHYLLLDIKDTGIGMDQEVLSNLFQRYFEGNKNLKIKSIGIGLSLTRDLVNKLHGSIDVKSEENRGTVFSLKIPIDREAFDEKDIYLSDDLTETILEFSEPLPINVYTHRDPLPHDEESDKHKMSVLIVEDNIDLLNAIVSQMELEFNIYKAGNGLKALEILKNNNSIDLIITDVLMPVMNGLELTMEIKKHIEYSHIPIIMLTARHDAEHKIEGFDSGADAYITKPFELDVLISNVKSLIRNRKALAASFVVESNENQIVDKFVHNETDKRFLEKVITYIENNITDREFSLINLYAEVNMSQPTFYRKLQALIALSPNELVRKIKIQTASRLLLEQNMNISEICYQLGFSEPRYFSSVFKKETGMSPSEYIKKNAKKG